MAKIGMVYVDGGQWQGKQIIPRDWVDASLKPHLPSSFTPGYGYQWWILRFESDERSMWVPSASGNGGQHIMVLRPLDMAVVLTAGNYNARPELDFIDILIEHVFPAAGLQGMKFIRAGQKSTPTSEWTPEPQHLLHQLPIELRDSPALKRASSR